MKQKLLFLALMAACSQTLPHWHGGYGYGWGGPGFGISIGGPGYYGPYGYGYGPGYYGYYDPVGAAIGTAGAIAATSAAHRAYELDRQYYSDPNKGRRSQLAGRIYDANQDLEFLKKSGASSSEISAKQAEIDKMNNDMNKLR